MKRASFLHRLAIAVTALSASLFPAASHAAETERLFRIYLDADRTENIASARSIELGIRTALSRDELVPPGVRFEFVPLDHRANAKRSFRNILSYLSDPDALVVIGGMHSPPYLTYREKINERGALLLLPWSAGGPITRGTEPANWIFRASVDDTKAGAFLARQAVVDGGCKTPALVLLNSGWGRFNEKKITEGLAALGMTDPPVHYYDADISSADVRIMTRDLQTSNRDCVIFVGNGRGSTQLIHELGQIPEPIRVFSHWGITGGSFPEQTDSAHRDHVDLQFIQTCLPFGRSDDPVVQSAVQRAQALFPDEFTTLEDQPAPVGFAHAYDLGLLLLAAMRDTSLDGDIEDVRATLRTALENIDTPVPGLLKTYDAPFSAEGFDSHEALGADDLCLARFDPGGSIVFVDREDGT